jgi:hypothetical protein
MDFCGGVLIVDDDGIIIACYICHIPLQHRIIFAMTVHLISIALFNYSVK